MNNSNKHFPIPSCSFNKMILFNEESVKKILKDYVDIITENIKEENEFYKSLSTNHLELENTLFTQRRRSNNEIFQTFFKRHILASGRNLNIRDKLTEEIEEKLIDGLFFYFYKKADLIDSLKIGFLNSNRSFPQIIEKIIRKELILKGDKELIRELKDLFSDLKITVPIDEEHSRIKKIFLYTETSILLVLTALIEIEKENIQIENQMPTKKRSKKCNLL